MGFKGSFEEVAREILLPEYIPSCYGLKPFFLKKIYIYIYIFTEGLFYGFFLDFWGFFIWLYKPYLHSIVTARHSRITSNAHYHAHSHARHHDHHHAHHYGHHHARPHDPPPHRT